MLDTTEPTALVEDTDEPIAADTDALDNATNEPSEPTAMIEDADGDDDDDDDLPPPPAAPVAPARSIVTPLPEGFVPLPVVPVGDPRIPVDANTLAEAAICATVFRRMAEHAEAHIAHILASDEELPPFYLDDEDRDLLAHLFARDTDLAARIRLAAGSAPRQAIA